MVDLLKLKGGRILNLVLLVFFLVTASVLGSQVKAGSLSETDIAIASMDSSSFYPSSGDAKPRENLVSEVVDESVAQALISQLQGWPVSGKPLAQALYLCSADHAFDKQGDTSICTDEYSGEVDRACLVRKGIGRRAVGEILKAQRVDLNGDNVLDYIMSDRHYCSDHSDNQASVYFVMLTDAKRGLTLSFADWASQDLLVVMHPENHSPVLVEKAVRIYGSYTQILHLRAGKYVPRICIVENAQGFAECPNNR